MSIVAEHIVLVLIVATPPGAPAQLPSWPAAGCVCLWQDTQPSDRTDGLQTAAAPDSNSPARGEAALFRAALETVAPAIVRIETIGGALPVKSETRGDQDIVRQPGFRQGQGPTSGVVWSTDGYILTSTFNFLRDPSVITVTLHDGRKSLAKLVGRDHIAGIALLKVETEGLKVVRWVDSVQLRPGQRVLSAGFGFGGEEPAIAVGIISGLNRMSGSAIQTDARISPAHYGGPLFDLAGQAVGVCVPRAPGGDETAGVEWYDSGIAFAVPRSYVQARIEQLKRGQDVYRGFMGVVLGPNEKPAGARVKEPPRGPAAQAGMRTGDVITHIDEYPTRTPEELRRRLAAKAAGDGVRVTYWRDGQPSAVELTLVRLEELPPPATQPATAPASEPAR